MNFGFELVTARRIWFVPDIVVWGLARTAEIEYLVEETVEAISTVLFGSIDISDSTQQVNFADLIDHRGNNLPVTIASPRVLIRSKTEHLVFVIGNESDKSFKIARQANATGVTTVDLLVTEMGN